MSRVDPPEAGLMAEADKGWGRDPGGLGEDLLTRGPDPSLEHHPSSLSSSSSLFL